MAILFSLSSDCYLCVFELLGSAAIPHAYKSWRRAECNNIMRISCDYLNFCYGSFRQAWCSVILSSITLAKILKVKVEI